MNNIKTKTFDSYCFGSLSGLSNPQMEQITDLFHNRVHSTKTVLGGRASVQAAQINGIGKSIVKQYFRGGLLRYFIKKRYLKWGKTRSQSEFEKLMDIRALGLGAPEPVAFAYTTDRFYQAWLITREIEDNQTLAKLSLKDENRTKEIMPEVTGQISKLIQNRIHHVDLHPGNVLITSDNEIFFIDFDKALIYQGDKIRLSKKYIKRWQRSIRKHKLPEILSIEFNKIF